MRNVIEIDLEERIEDVHTFVFLKESEEVRNCFFLDILNGYVNRTLRNS